MRNPNNRNKANSQNTKKRKKRYSDEFENDTYSDFYFVAGYTSWGFAFGTEIDSEENAPDDDTKGPDDKLPF